MDFRVTPEQELFKKTVRDFCEEKIFPRSREIDEKGEIIPDDIIKEMVELGIFGVTIIARGNNFLMSDIRAAG